MTSIFQALLSNLIEKHILNVCIRLSAWIFCYNRKAFKISIVCPKQVLFMDWPFRSYSIRSDFKMEYKNRPRLCTGTGKSTQVSKICNLRRGLPSRGCWKSLTRGWISLSLYEVVVYYFSPTALNPYFKTPFSLSKTTSKRCLVRKRRQLWLIMTSRHCMIYDVTRCSLKRSCL